MKDPLRGTLLLCGGVFALVGGVFTALGCWFFGNMDVLYDHGTGDVDAMPYIFTFLGVVLLAVGLLIFSILIRRARKRARLISTGRYLTAEITDMRPDFSFRVNRMPTYRAVCVYTDPVTGATHVFQSMNLLYRQDHLTGRQVRVYVADKGGEQYADYYVDLEPLLSQTAEYPR